MNQLEAQLSSLKNAYFQNLEMNYGARKALAKSNRDIESLSAEINRVQGLIQAQASGANQ